ncbi:MAG: hypothetical protein ABF449_03015 [Ethanoligenens sp.]
MFVYAVFDSKDAAELAMEHISHAIPHARVQQFSSAKHPPQKNDRNDVSGGEVFGTPGMSTGQGAFFSLYPPSLNNVWGTPNAAGEHPDTETLNGGTALRVQVPDKDAADRAAGIMRQMGGTGVRT